MQALEIEKDTLLNGVQMRKHDNCLGAFNSEYLSAQFQIP